MRPRSPRREPGATLVRRERPAGRRPRATPGSSTSTTELVAFLDSDTLPPPDWIERLAGHFDDPRVAAVAPRVRALERRRSPLDMGPGRTVPYVPSAALIVRSARRASTSAALRRGRRPRSGGCSTPATASSTTRASSCTTRSATRSGGASAYGTSAAPLAHRHPGRMRHVVLPRRATAGCAQALPRERHRRATSRCSWTADGLARHRQRPGRTSRRLPTESGSLSGKNTRTSNYLRSEYLMSDHQAAHRAGGAHDALRRADQGALRAGGRRPARRADRAAGRVPVHPRRLPDDVPRAPVDDAPVRRLRHRRGDQRALPLPARPRADGALHRVRHAGADGPRLRPARAASARSAARASRSTRSTTWRRSSRASTSATSRSR